MEGEEAEREKGGKNEQGENSEGKTNSSTEPPLSMSNPKSVSCPWLGEGVRQDLSNPQKELLLPTCASCSCSASPPGTLLSGLL